MLFIKLLIGEETLIQLGIAPFMRIAKWTEQGAHNLQFVSFQIGHKERAKSEEGKADETEEKRSSQRAKLARFFMPLCLHEHVRRHVCAGRQLAAGPPLKKTKTQQKPGNCKSAGKTQETPTVNAGKEQDSTAIDDKQTQESRLMKGNSVSLTGESTLKRTSKREDTSVRSPRQTSIPKKIRVWGVISERGNRARETKEGRVATERKRGKQPDELHGNAGTLNNARPHSTMLCNTKGCARDWSNVRQEKRSQPDQGGKKLIMQCLDD